MALLLVVTRASPSRVTRVSKSLVFLDDVALLSLSLSLSLDESSLPEDESSKLPLLLLSSSDDDEEDSPAQHIKLLLLRHQDNVRSRCCKSMVTLRRGQACTYSMPHVQVPVLHHRAWRCLTLLLRIWE